MWKFCQGFNQWSRQKGYILKEFSCWQCIVFRGQDDHERYGRRLHSGHKEIKLCSSRSWDPRKTILHFGSFGYHWYDFDGVVVMWNLRHGLLSEAQGNLISWSLGRIDHPCLVQLADMMILRKTQSLYLQGIPRYNCWKSPTVMLGACNHSANK